MSTMSSTVKSNGSVLSLDFSNVSLKNKVLAGKSYKPAPLDVGHTAVGR